MDLSPDMRIDHGFWMRGRWWRRRYFIQDGLIRPVAGSTLGYYDPFVGYYQDEHPRAGNSLYTQILDLDLDSERAIEEFVSRWGLLGLFQDGLIDARHYYPRLPERHEAPGHPGYYGAWHSTPEHSTVLVSEVEAQHLAAHLEARALYGMYSRRTLPMREYFSRFLPGLKLNVWGSPFHAGAGEGERSQPDHALLASDGLWDWLCEPLDLFRLHIRMFRLLLNEAKAMPPIQFDWPPEDEIPVAPVAPLTSEEMILVTMGLAYALNEGASRVTPRLVVRGGKWSRGWTFPSLKSALYMMLHLDITGGRLRECENDRCKRPFVPVRADQKFCQNRCANATKQRLHRERIRKAREGE